MSNTETVKRPKINRAVIDIGTNSTRMLIFREDKHGKLFRVNKSVRYTRMGQGVNQTKKLHPDAIKRNLEALEEFKGIAADYDVQDMMIFGTSALRDAENSQEFVALAKKNLDLDVKIISGEEEAELGFLGVSQCFAERILIFDIGGGSTEIICGEGSDLKKMMSLNLGCVRSTEAYIKNDPPEAAELEAMNRDALAQLKAALAGYEAFKPYTMVGIGGTATTISTIQQKLKIYNSEKVHQSRIAKTELEAILTDLSAKTTAQRSEIVGLEAKRADIIVAGASILKDILEAAKEDSFVVCDYDNLEGAAYRYFFNA